MNFILTRYDNDNGRLIANPSIEITASPKKQTANVVTFKNPHYFHSAVAKSDEIGTIPLSQANRYLYDWLGDLAKAKKAASNDNYPRIAKFTHGGGI